METTKLSQLASALLEDIDGLRSPYYSDAWHQQAVQLVADAFERAVQIETAAPQEDVVRLKGWRWCSKCQASYPASAACEHFAPYTQAP